MTSDNDRMNVPSYMRYPSLPFHYGSQSPRARFEIHYTTYNIMQPRKFYLTPSTIYSTLRL